VSQRPLLGVQGLAHLEQQAASLLELAIELLAVLERSAELLLEPLSLRLSSAQLVPQGLPVSGAPWSIIVIPPRRALGLQRRR
jgi:hypothetical protein